MADERLWDAEPTPAIDIDCEVAPALFAGEGLDFIKSMAPLGAGNPPPVFVTRKARVVEARQVGKHADHLKMRVLHEGSTWDVIAFRQGDRLQAARDRIDLVYSVGEDNWGGRPRIQLKALDFRPSR
jgi:single-stranded-DNA-specific exonuclease